MNPVSRSFGGLGVFSLEDDASRFEASPVAGDGVGLGPVRRRIGGCAANCGVVSRSRLICDTTAGHRRGRTDRAPERCRAGGGLLGGKDPAGHFALGVVISMMSGFAARGVQKGLTLLDVTLLLVACAVDRLSSLTPDPDGSAGSDEVGLENPTS